MMEAQTTPIAGALLDLAARVGWGSTRGLATQLDKGLAFRTILPFFFRSGGGRTAHAYTGVKAARHKRGRDDKAQVQFHYDVSNAFYALAFERGTVGIFQTVATKRARGASGLPPTRRDLYA